jgi:hypothetical protein
MSGLNAEQDEHDQRQSLRQRRMGSSSRSKAGAVLPSSPGGTWGVPDKEASSARWRSSPRNNLTVKPGKRRPSLFELQRPADGVNSRLGGSRKVTRLVLCMRCDVPSFNLTLADHAGWARPGAGVALGQDRLPGHLADRAHHRTSPEVSRDAILVLLRPTRIRLEFTFQLASGFRFASGEQAWKQASARGRQWGL